MRRCRTRARSHVIWSVLFALVFGLCSADVDVVVNLAGADAVLPEPFQSVRGFLELSSMDNSDLFVAMCLPGTFSPDHEGVCHDCVKCLPNQFERQACIPTRDRTCANCTVCGSHDIELCQCAVKTSQCVTGDRVCLRVPPTVVTLVVDFTSNGVLSAKQQTFIRSGLAVGYTDWLAIQFDVDPETVELTDFVRTGSVTYKAYFRFGEVYGESKVTRIQSQPHDFFQGGIYYTFGGGGRRRRLLQAGAEAGRDHQRRLLQVGVGTNYLTASGTLTLCEVDTNCSQPFTEFQFFNGSTCSGYCAPVPCPAGYGGGATNCQPCPPNTFKGEPGFGDCTECPAEYTSPTGSNSSEDCVVDPTMTSASSPGTITDTPSLRIPTTTAAGRTPSPSSSYASSPQQSSSTSPSTQRGTSSQIPAPSQTSAPSRTSAPASSAASLLPSSPSAASSAAPSAGPVQTSGTPPPPPPPPTQALPQITSSYTGSPPAGSSGSSSSGNANANTNNNANNNNNNNANTNNVNVNVQVQPPPPPAVLGAVFNNYVTIQQPQPRPRPEPEPSMPDSNAYHHDHYFLDAYYDHAYVLVLLLFFLVSLALCAACALSAPPPQAYYAAPERDRPVVRYRLVREEVTALPT